MKIAFLSFYSGEYFRGVETYVRFLGNELTKLGHEVVVYQNGPKMYGAKYKTVSLRMKVDWNKKGNESKRVLNVFTNYWMQIVGQFTRKVLSQIEKEVDIVIPTNGNLQTLYCRIWCLLHGKKMVLTGLSGPGWDDRFNLWCFPHVFVAASEFQRQWAMKANPFVRSIRIPYGAHLEVFAKNSRKMKLGLQSPVILGVGAFVRMKRHELTIEAVSKLKRGSLVIAGADGDFQDELQRLGDRKLPGRFMLMNVPHDKIAELYKACDVFVFPTSPWESFGIVLVEAMASGLPVVASNDPIRKEIVGNAGILVNPTDSNAYANSILKALRTDWGDAPRKQAEKFGWDSIAREYEELFTKLLK